MVYTDDRNWDQEELDRARNLAKDNVVTEGSSVPNAAKLHQENTVDSEEPSPVLEGERPTTEQEREAVNGTDNDEDSPAKKEFEQDAEEQDNRA